MQDTVENFQKDLTSHTIIEMETKTQKKDFFNPGVTVDVVIFTIEDGKLKIILIDRQKEPFKGFTALPGGFMIKGETSKDTAKRVLKEKAGVNDIYIEQLFTFDSLNRDPRGQILSIAYFALVPKEEIKIKSASENPELISIGEISRLPFDHNQIINYALKRLSDKVQYSNIIYSLLPKYFSLTNLQKIYEIILQRKIDKRNFRKKILGLDILKQSKEIITGKRQRPAKLYSFKSKKFQELNKFI